MAVLESDRHTGAYDLLDPRFRGFGSNGRSPKTTAGCPKNGRPWRTPLFLMHDQTAVDIDRLTSKTIAQVAGEE
jgi:hypothetical protein